MSTSVGVRYESPHSTSFAVIPVLPALYGLPWDEFAFQWVVALRPSLVRVTAGEITCDARLWRVTVYLTSLTSKYRIIDRIEQEVEIGCEGFAHGHDMQQELIKRQREYRGD